MTVKNDTAIRRGIFFFLRKFIRIQKMTIAVNSKIRAAIEVKQLWVFRPLKGSRNHRTETSLATIM
jgi:hypothetical protein